MTDRLGLGREFQRKAIHFFTSLIPLVYYYLSITREQMLVICVTITIVFIFFDILRLLSKIIEQYFLMVFSKLLRKSEIEKKLTGATYLFIGLSLSILLFPKEIAVPAMLFLTLADPLAAVIGKIYRIKSIFEKSLAGFLAFVMMASAVVLLWTNFGILGMIVAFLAGIIELLPLKVNDNLTVPICSGYLFYLIRYL